MTVARAFALLVLLLLLGALGVLLATEATPSGEAGDLRALPALDGPGGAARDPFGAARRASVAPEGPAQRAEPLPLDVPAAGPLEVGADARDGMVLRGRVVDAAGRPLAGARVRASRHGGAAEGRHLATVADADGAFELLVDEPDGRELRVTHPGHAGSASAPLGEIDGELLVVLDPVAQLELLLRDERGQPAAGVVRAQDLEPPTPWDAEAGRLASSWSEIATVRAGDDGLARLALRAGRWRLVGARADEDLPSDVSAAVPRHLERSTIQLELAGGPGRVSLDLPTTGQLWGRVEPPSSDVVVQLRRPDDENGAAPAIHASRRLELDGSFLFEGVLQGSWVVSAWRPGTDVRAGARVELGVGQRRRIDLSLAGPRVTALVYDALSRKVVQPASFVVWREPDDADPDERPARPPVAAGETLADKANARRIDPPVNADGRHDLSALAPGRYRLWAFLDDPPYRPAVAAWLEVTDDQRATSVELPVAAATRLEVNVLGGGAHDGLVVDVGASDDRSAPARLVFDSAASGALSFRTSAILPGWHSVIVRDGAGRILAHERVQLDAGRENVLDIAVRGRRP